MVLISTMPNGGTLIEVIASKPAATCPWRSADTCKSCDNVDCPRKITNESED